jgi:hypothetical protein
MRLLLYELIAVLSIPLVEVTVFTLIWHRSLANPWLFALVGCIVAYAIAAGALLTARKYSESGGWNFKPGTTAKPSDGPLLLFAGLLATVVVLSGLALWGLRSFFVSSTP